MHNNEPLSEAASLRKELAEALPESIGIRTMHYAPLLRKWRKQNKNASWKMLLKSALNRELKPLAGKRWAYLVEN